MRVESSSVESPAEARFTRPNQNCYNTDNKQESFVSTGLRNECCTGYCGAEGSEHIDTALLIQPQDFLV